MAENSNLNTIIGWSLASVLGVLGLGAAGEALYGSHYPEKPGYEVAIAEAPAAGEAKGKVEAPIDWGTQFGDDAQLTSLVAAGEKVHAQCTSCHSFDKGGANGTGPALWDVVGRVSGTYAGFAYSEPMKAHAAPWSYDELSKFLAAPAGYIRGTKMAFAGVKKEESRVALIAFLRSRADSPAPVPAPLPVVAPEAAAPVEGEAPAPAEAEKEG